MSEKRSDQDGTAPSADLHEETRCLTSAIASEVGHGFSSLVTPIYRASTVVFPTLAAYRDRHKDVLTGYSYGLYGTPTTRELEIRMSVLEEANRTLLTPSGMAAIALVTLTEARPGNIVLLPDNVYQAVRHFAATLLHAMNIRVVFYDPLIGSGIEGILSDEVALVWVESPGSVTLEVQDVAAIADAAHARGIKVAADNTWATALRFKPLRHRVDYCVNSLSKYISGHSDVVMGAISVTDENLYVALRQIARSLGYGVTSDAASLVLRGIETLPARLDRSEASALDLARWLSEQPYVSRVLHPALDSHPGHTTWKRDFSGSTSLFSIVLAPEVAHSLPAAIESLNIFKLGASWGGTHSVVSAFEQPFIRTAIPWREEGPIVRLSVGLEHVEDLRRDLDQAMRVLSSSA